MDDTTSNRLAEFVAILFRAGRVVPLDKLVEHFGCKAHELAVMAEETNRHLEPLGLQAGFVAGGYRLTTRPEVYHALREFFTELRESGISPQAMEVLAIVAYRQPVTRASVEEIRQVNSESPLRSLLQRRLIKVKGRSDLPGRPFLYVTTGRFLEVFGLSGLDDLPKIALDEPAPGERVGI
ncbi:SMC-Scp complex subunit ScpB [bacterium]|nr:SMC-Scp complex subunit ScpB [bacterium]